MVDEISGAVRQDRLRFKTGRGQLREKVRFMQYSSDWFDALYVSEKEMKNILKGTGWKAMKFIKGKDFRKDGRFTAIIKKA